jgi:hypothetical protein
MRELRITELERGMNQVMNKGCLIRGGSVQSNRMLQSVAYMRTPQKQTANEDLPTIRPGTVLYTYSILTKPGSAIRIDESRQ